MSYWLSRWQVAVVASSGNLLLRLAQQQLNMRLLLSGKQTFKTLVTNPSYKLLRVKLYIFYFTLLHLSSSCQVAHKASTLRRQPALSAAVMFTSLRVLLPALSRSFSALSSTFFI